MTVLGDVAHSERSDLSWAGVGEVIVEQGDAAGLDGTEAVERLDQLGLTVPLDASDPKDLACSHREIHAVNGRAPALVPYAQVLDSKHRLARVRWRPLNRQFD